VKQSVDERWASAETLVLYQISRHRVDNAFRL
jgi:hypothetical protein